MTYVPRLTLQPSEKYQGGQDFPFSTRPTPPTKGDQRPDKIHLAVGRALSEWEYTESSFARLFAVFVRPERPGGSSLRAYGSIETARGRKGMIEEASLVFFNFFPSDELKDLVRQLLKQYSDASSRRNDLAHGIVLPGPKPKHEGFYLTSNLHTSKRGLRLEPVYCYTARQIEVMRLDFVALRCRADSTINQLMAFHISSPKKSRERY